MYHARCHTPAEASVQDGWRLTVEDSADNHLYRTVLEAHHACSSSTILTMGMEDELSCSNRPSHVLQQNARQLQSRLWCILVVHMWTAQQLL